MSFVARALRAALVVGGVVVLPWGLYVAWRSYRIEASFFTGQRHVVDLGPALSALPDSKVLSFLSEGAKLRAVYAPSKNGAGVVLCHGSGGDRNALLVEAKALHDRGFGTLLFDLPGHGESEGEVHWSEGEVRALRAAVDLLVAQPDVKPQRVGAVGVSMGGYLVALGAARDARLRGVAVVAAPHDARAHALWEYQRWGALSQQPALLALRWHGMDLDGETPLKVVKRIAPRELLIVGSTSDHVVPREAFELLYAAAAVPKQLYWVEGGEHGAYADANDSRYLEVLGTFFERTLR